MQLRATHLGTATMLLEVGPFRLLTDPVFDPPGATYSVLGIARYRSVATPIRPKDLGRIDAVLLSHDQHGDNLDREGLAVARTAARILTTTSGAGRLGGAAIGLEPWKSHELASADGARLRITATPAQHGPRLLVSLAGPVIGFALEWEGQERGAVWISGDTVLFDGVREVAKHFRPGSAFLHVGRATLTPTRPVHYTFTADEAAQTARLLGDSAIYPIHYDGWSHFREGRKDVEEAFAREGLSPRLRWLPRGEAAAIPS